MTECLTESVLDALAAGSLASSDLAESERHLAECAACRDAIAARRADDQLFADIRQAFRMPDGAGGQAESSSGVAMRDAPPAAERLTIDGYKILNDLHRGGQGVVYKAIQCATKRTVALKLLLQGAYATPRQRQRFEREVDAVASLQHSNIVTIYESGVSDGRPFYAMEFVDGQPLDLFRKSGAAAGSPQSHATIREATCLFRKIAAAVSYAHRRGVIHRDLKPANILIDAAGEPHILDFGLAKSAAPDSQDRQLTEAGEFLGTLAYASPEQARGDPLDIDVRTDVYSLGVILFEMLTGMFPYPVSGPLSEALQHIGETEPRRPSSIRREIDGELETIVLKALAKEPERRYQSAEHLSRDVSHYLNGEPIDAKRDSTWYLLRKSLRRYRAAVATAAAFAVTIVAALAVSIHLWREAVADRDRTRLAQSNEKSARNAEAEARQDERTQREEAEFQSYVANIAAAGAAIRAFDVQDARGRLDRAPERLRGWEWRHLFHLLDSSDRTLSGHSAYVESVAFSPDGRRVASASWDKTVRMWNAETGGEIMAVATPAEAWTVSFSPDSRWFAAGSWDGTVRVWDAKSGKFSASFETPSQKVSSVAFSPDGTKLAAAFGFYEPDAVKGIREWDVASREVVRTTMEDGLVSALAYNPDGTRLAAVTTRGVSLRDAATGEEVRTLTTDDWLAAQNTSVAFNPAGTRVAAPDGRKAVRIWDTATGAEVGRLRGHTRAVHSVAFSSDGQRIVTGSRDKTIRLWDAANFSETGVLCGHSWTVTSVAFAGHGRRVASSSWDGSVKLWNVEPPAGAAPWRGHSRAVTSVAFDRKGSRVATASLDGTIRVWDATTGRCTHTLSGHTSPVQCVAFSPDGARVASASWDETVRLWDAATGRVLHSLAGHAANVHAVAFSPDGRWLLSGSRDNSLRIWDPATGDPVGTLAGHTDHIHCVAFSPDGRRFMSSGHASLKVWDAERRTELASLARSIIQEDYSLAVHPDGERVAAGLDARTLAIWNVTRQQIVARLAGHTDEILSAAFSPDGSRLVSSSTDGTVKLWDVAIAREVASLHGHTAVANCVAFSPDGTRIVAGLGDGSVKVWATDGR